MRPSNEKLMKHISKTNTWKHTIKKRKCESPPRAQGTAVALVSCAKDGCNYMSPAALWKKEVSLKPLLFTSYSSCQFHKALCTTCTAVCFCSCITYYISVYLHLCEPSCWTCQCKHWSKKCCIRGASWSLLNPQTDRGCAAAAAAARRPVVRDCRGYK